MLAVADRARDELVVAVERLHGADVAAVQRAVVDREIGEVAVGRVAVRAAHLHRVREIADRAVVEILAVQPDIAAIAERLGDVRLELAALHAVIADLPLAVADPVEAAKMIGQRVGQLAALVEIDAEFAVVEPAGQLERAAFLLAGLRDEVDDAAGRVRREGRSRAAADGLYRPDVEIGAQEIVRVAEGDVAELEDRQAVFLQLEELRAARCDRQAADRDVRVAVAARGLDPDAGEVAEQLTRGAGCELDQRVRVDRAGGDRGVQPVGAARDRGHDDVVLRRVGSGSSGAIGRRGGLVGLRCGLCGPCGGERCGGDTGQQCVTNFHAILPATAF